MSGVPEGELEDLATEIRQAIISACLTNGGHLGASLGTVELAIALHRSFRSPAEPILWDVGHQAYAHKWLTGRAEALSTLRRRGGISGFLSRAESPHDFFGAGHSSTILSAALAAAWARAQDKPDDPDWTVAVVGDGALSAGMGFEALNQLGSFPLGRLLIVVNDNRLSISGNVGAVNELLGAGRARALFELFGADFTGPIDGHDFGQLLSALETVRARPADGRPVVLHVLTEKGRGYAPAERDPVAFHGVAKIEAGRTAARGPTFSRAFGDWCLERAERDPRFVVVSPAMTAGSGLQAFAAARPDRFFDVGIAEQHAVTFCAGLAAAGWRPVCAIYSTFLQRAWDQLIHDVALQRLPVVFAIDRAGWVGADGATHQGAFDVAALRPIPHVEIRSVGSREGLRRALERGLARTDGPTAVRFPRGEAPERARWEREGAADDLDWRWLAGERSARILCVGDGILADRWLEARDRLSPDARATTAVAALERVHPLPGGFAARIGELAAAGLREIRVLEAASVTGGLADSVRAVFHGPVRALGFPAESFVEHAEPGEQERECGVDVDSLLALWTDVAES